MELESHTKKSIVNLVGSEELLKCHELKGTLDKVQMKDHRENHSLPKFTSQEQDIRMKPLPFVYSLDIIPVLPVVPVMPFVAEGSVQGSLWWSVVKAPSV